MAFNGTNLTILRQLQRGNNWLRAVLCTLARRGVAFRLAYPIQAQYILDSMINLPYYKGGQFLFDIMEWEDFMLDGPPMPVLSSIFNVPMSDSVKALSLTVTRTISAQFGSSDNGSSFEEEEFVLPEGELPPLESSFYLYQEVILGLIASQLVRNLEPGGAKDGESGNINLVLDPEAVVLAPGEVKTIFVKLESNARLDRDIQMGVEGIPLGWASFTENSFYLPAGAEKRIGLTIQAPTDNPSLAHLYSYKVFVIWGVDGEPVSQAEGTLLIQSLVTVKQQETESFNTPEHE